MTSRWNCRIVAASLATAIVFVLVFCVPIAVRGQAAGATLSGTVKDASGATIPNANVSIKNRDTGVTRAVATDAAGLYNAPNLSPGIYEVTTSAQGFSKLVQSGITLIVGGQQVLNITLQVGQVTQTVEVTAEAPQVDLTSSAITAVVNPTTIVELPLNGRDWSSLATLQPGTLAIRTQVSTSGSKNRANRGFGNQLAVAGHRPNENNYRLNGISIADYTNAAPGSVLGAQLGVDAIQEFSVVTANYTAEYGRTSGGVVNAITKPGTNAFHGSAYWFLRDGKLDATSFFAPTKAPFHRNQFGGSVGGPIRKDRTFWFADYEGVRQTKGLNAAKLTVPSQAFRQGTLCSTIAATAVCPDDGIMGPHQVTGAFNPDPTTGISKLVLPFLPLYPTQNAGLVPTGNGDTAFFVSSPVQTFSETYVTGRVDHKFSDRDSIDGVFFFDKSPQTAPDSFLESLSDVYSSRIMGGVEETHIFSPTLVNTFRGGLSRTHGYATFPVSAILPIAADTSLGLTPGHAAPRLSVTGLAQAAGSIGSAACQEWLQDSYQVNDDAFLTKGANNFKFGFSVERLHQDKTGSQGNCGTTGTASFGSLLAFLQDAPLSIALSAPTATPTVQGRQTFYGFYAQDDWRVRPNLTLNLGLRYEPSTLPVEAANKFTVLTSLTGNLTSVPSAHLWQTNQTLHNFEPRVGLAWDPFHNGKTSVRAGFGIFDVLPGPWMWATRAANGTNFTQSLSASNLLPGDFPTAAAAKLQAANILNANFMEQNPKNNYAMNWNLNIQRQLTSTLTAMVAYVGSHTVHNSFQMDDTNMVFPGTVPGLGVQNVWPCGPPIVNGQCTAGVDSTGATTVKIDPKVAAVPPQWWVAGAKYNSFQVQLTKRMSHGLQVQASYTWSRCLDQGSSTGVSDGFNNSLSSLIVFEASQSNAPCDYNIPNNFVGNWIWEIPSPKSSAAIVNRLAGGWQLGGIITASNGTPFTLVMAGDPLKERNTDPWDFASYIPGCNPVNSNWKTTMQYVNTSCFAPPFAPASFASQCANFSGASAAALPSGNVWCANLFGDAGRNSVIGPGLFDLDFSVFKNNYIPRISEVFNIQFRAEFFNVLNHPNLQSPLSDNALFTATGAPQGGAGILNDVTTDPRDIQFSLKIIF